MQSLTWELPPWCIFVSMVAMRAADREFDPWLNQTTDYEIGF